MSMCLSWVRPGPYSSGPACRACFCFVFVLRSMGFTVTFFRLFLRAWNIVIPPPGIWLTVRVHNSVRSGLWFELRFPTAVLLCMVGGKVGGSVVGVWVVCGSVGLPEPAIFFRRLVLHRRTMQKTQPCSVLARCFCCVRACYHSSTAEPLYTRLLRVSTPLHVGGWVEAIVSAYEAFSPTGAAAYH